MSNMHQPVKERQLAETVTSGLKIAYMKSNVHFVIGCHVISGQIGILTWFKLKDNMHVDVRYTSHSHQKNGHKHIGMPMDYILASKLVKKIQKSCTMEI